jgi:hypothetical protein
MTISRNQLLIMNYKNYEFIPIVFIRKLDLLDN